LSYLEIIGYADGYASYSFWGAATCYVFWLYESVLLKLPKPTINLKVSIWLVLAAMTVSGFCNVFLDAYYLKIYEIEDGAIKANIQARSHLNRIIPR
jgi:hypothetical protein